jgi:hypothetical protein
MLSINAQGRLFEKYCGTPLRKSIHENFSMEDFKNKINNKVGFSSVIYIDISDFSNKISNWSTVDVKNYLNAYYNKTMPLIQKYNGQIDKIMGDGIIVVFSKLFPNIDRDADASNKSFYCCKEIVEELYNTEYEIKAAIGNGKLYFCKTGVEQIYEEYTAIGHPMTIAYRLENIAENNQILLMRNTHLSKRIEKTGDYLNQWEQSEKTVFLKGVNSSRIHILQY